MKNDLVEAIRERLSVEEVVADYLELKRSGRNLKALSPFSHEKTPSFIVSPDKQIWHDFSSGKGGTLFGFVMEMEGVDFREALKILAQKAGLNPAEYNQGGSATNEKRKQAILSGLALAARFYQYQLINNPTALDYVTKKRGFNKESVRNFYIGYAPDNWSALFNYLKSKGISSEIAQAAGLVGKSEKGRFYDMFRGRIMIPLMDPQAKVIGFTSRTIIDGTDAPKYINTSQTLVYDKSRHVFGYSQAKEEIRKTGYVVIVEGNLDVVTSHQAAVRNVVATAGTAMTIQHLKLISRTVSDIRLAFDADEAGIKATERIINLAQENSLSQVGGIKLSIVDLPTGQDPDDLIRQDAKAWADLIKKPEYALDWLYNKYKQQLDITSAQGKRDFTDIVLQVVGKLKDEVEREHYLKLLATDTDTSLLAMSNKLNTIKSNTASEIKRIRKAPATVLPTLQQDNNDLESRLLGLLILYPLTRHQKINTELRFSDADKQLVYQYLLNDPQVTINDSELPDSLRDQEECVKLAVLIASEKYKGFRPNDKLREVVDLAKKLVETTKKERIRALTEDLKQAEAKKDNNRVNEIVKEIDAINQSLQPT